MSGLQMLMLGLGALALLIGVAVAIQRVRVLAGGRTATGRVVGHREQTHSGSRGTMTKLAAPIVEFEHDGRKVRFHSELAQKNPPPVGATVAVRYLPADPEGSAAVASVLAFWGLPVVMLVFGAAVVAFVLNQPGTVAPQASPPQARTK